MMSRIVGALLFTALVSCSSRDRPNPSNRGPDTPAPPAPPAREPSPTTASVTEQGIGPLRVGMTAAEARSVLTRFDLPRNAERSGCMYASVTGLPPGVRVMVDNGTVARIEVDTSLVPTIEGARVGDSEASVRALYGNRLTISPHKYTDGHYLTVKPSSAADTLHRIVFETGNGRVVKYRAGRLPQVEYVEGCS